MVSSLACSNHKCFALCRFVMACALARALKRFTRGRVAPARPPRSFLIRSPSAQSKSVREMDREKGKMERSEAEIKAKMKKLTVERACPSAPAGIPPPPAPPPHAKNATTQKTQKT